MPPSAALPYVSRVPLSWPQTEGPALHEVEGTLLFVDVAGFTALSERLARQEGRAGAEELTAVLNRAFERLLGTAYAHGGSLLSFGGDALLLLFGGPDHQRRGARAAAELRAAPRAMGPLESSAGPVRLRLSMGAHSGVFQFAVTGAGSRVVLLLGADATRTVRLEQRAVAGQCLLGEALAHAVPEAVGPVVDGAALLQRRPRPAVDASPPWVGELVTLPETFLDPVLAGHVVGAPTSEHRRVAVGFLQLRGTDALLASDPQGALEAVDAVVRRAQQAAADHAVCLLASDIDADGAKLILVGGAPRATEHEEERLLRALRSVLDEPGPLELRGGVTAGHVFVGDVGPPYRRAFTVMGERVNLAARLMASAAPGELRTLPKVLSASSTRFAVRSLPPLRLKGIAEPVQAIAVGRPLGQVETGSAELVGREEELAVLTAALVRAQGGTGGSVEVVGEAGVGKTALLAALADAADCPVLRVAAAPYESSTPYGTVKRVLRSVLRVDGETPAREVGRVASASLHGLSAADLALVLVAADAELDGDGPVGGPVQQDDLFEQRLARAVRRALELLVPGPALLVVEDLQWADPSSTALLRSVADGLRDRPWLLATSWRPGAAGTTPAVLGRGEVIWLAALDVEPATQLVHALTADAPLSPHRAAALVARSGGNPLFLTQLVASGLDGDELPDSVEAVVHARIDALPDYLRTLLRKGAVLGTAFDLDLLAEIGGFVPDRTEWRLLDGLLHREGSRGVFAGEVFRDAAYSSLLYADRRALHRQAGRALAARGSADVELLALHAAEARDDALTWTYAVEAGRRAAARGAHETARRAFERALVAHQRARLGPEAETCDVHTALGDALVRAGDPQRATASYRKARSLSPRGLVGDPALCHKEALARIELGRHAGARRWLAAGLRAVGPQDELVELQLLASQAGVQYRQGRFSGALRTLLALVERTEGTRHRRSNAHAHDLLHLVLTTLGDPRRADHRTQALATYEELEDVSGQAHVLNNLGMDAYYEGRWSEAVQLFERSRVCEEADANDVGAAVSEMNVGEVLLDQGSFEEAHERLTRALRTFVAGDFRIGAATVFAFLGRLETRRGGYDQAAEHLRSAREVVVETGAESLLPDLVVRECELAVCRGLVEAAEEQLDVLEQLPDVGAEMHLVAARLRAAVRVRQGDDAAAEALLRQAISAESGSGRFTSAIARHGLAVLLTRRGDPEAETQRHAALEGLRRLGVHRFRDPVAGDELLTISLPPAVVDLSQVRQERISAAV